MTTTTTRAPRRDAAENRESLIAAAKTELNRDPSASLETIAAAAGLSRRSVYGHFANRDELLLELVTSGATRVAGALDGVTHPDRVVRRALRAARLGRAVDAVGVLAVVAGRGPRAAHTTTALAPVRRRVREAIAEGQAAGSMRQDLPPALLARLVEETALSVLEESARHPLPARDGDDLVMLMTLGTVGFGWREARAVIDANTELQWKGE